MFRVLFGLGHGVYVCMYACIGLGFVYYHVWASSLSAAAAARIGGPFFFYLCLGVRVFCCVLGSVTCLLAMAMEMEMKASAFLLFCFWCKRIWRHFLSLCVTQF